MKTMKKTVHLGLLGAAIFSMLPDRDLMAQTVTHGTANTYVNSTSGNTVVWSAQDPYWRSNYNARPYYNNALDYSSYQPAYQYGVNAYNQYNGAPYSTLDQNMLRNNWNNVRGNSQLNWDKASVAFQDSYDRLYNSQHNINGGTSSTVGAGARVGATTSGIRAGGAAGSAASGMGVSGSSGR